VLKREGLEIVRSLGEFALSEDREVKRLS
jgi:hypothetical protein